MTTAKTIARDAISVTARAVLAVTFIWASIHKIADPSDFALQIATYQILPLGLINLQAIVLPWLEIITGLLLVVGLSTRPAALLTCGMNVMFIAAIAIALSNDLQLQCGCFASSQAGDQMDAGLLFRDVLLLLAGAFLVAIEPDRLTLDHFLSRRKSHAHA